MSDLWKRITAWRLLAAGLVLAALPSIAGAQNFELKLTNPLPKFQPEATDATGAYWLAVAPASVGFTFGTGESSQQASNSTSSPSVAAPIERHVFRHILSDQKILWTSPFHADRRHAKWLIPVVAVTAVMIGFDKEASRRISSARGFVQPSHEISNLGNDYVNYGIAGTTYLLGKAVHNRRAQESGFLGLEAALYSSEFIRFLKIATNRKRPVHGGNGHFWNGGKSFASGHSAHSWAIATVFAHQYSNRPLIKYGAYTWATMVSLSRLTGKNHYPSDVLVGSTIGYLVGRFVARHHGRPPRKP